MGRVDRGRPVEGHAQLATGPQPLQRVHVVGHRRAAGGLVEQVVVPARPCRAPARQQRAVGVKHRLVGLVGERAEDLVLAVRGIRQRRQRLVGVGCQHDLVEALRLAAAWRDEHVIVKSPHAGDGRVQAYAVGERRRQRLDVARRSTRDRAPLRPPRQRQHPVVVEERDEEARGEGPHLVRIGRPDRRGLGHDQLAHERVGVAQLREPVAQRRAVVAGLEQHARIAVEAHVVPDHPHERRARQVARLCQQPAW
jgi:hypothetical protein